MGKLVILIGFQAIATTTIISAFTVFGLPALSQETEAEGQPKPTEVVESSVVKFCGVLLSLASLGINLGPILAVVGGVSFVLAFALQSNLGNFASGLMLLINKPFDVGDEVKVAGYWAYVDSI